MERTIKLITCSIFSIIILLPVNAANTQNATANTKTELTNCVKTFPIGYEKLFYLALAGMNEYDYQIKEVQSKGGYIVFITNNQKFLASIVYVSSTKSMLKITSFNGDYNFSSEIPQKLFKYIETNQTKTF